YPCGRGVKTGSQAVTPDGRSTGRRAKLPASGGSQTKSVCVKVLALKRFCTDCRFHRAPVPPHARCFGRTRGGMRGGTETQSDDDDCDCHDGYGYYTHPSLHDWVQLGPWPLISATFRLRAVVARSIRSNSGRTNCPR